MVLMALQLCPPDDSREFEKLCLRAFRRELKCPSLKLFGRSGQDQGGIDLIGVDEAGTTISVQAKVRTKGELSTADIDNDIASAINAHPDLGLLVIATTAPRSVTADRHVASRSAENIGKQLFEIRLFAWEDIADLIRSDVDHLADYTSGVHGSMGSHIFDKVSNIENALRNPAPVGECKADFEQALSEARAGRPDEAIGRLRLLREQRWPTASSDLRYKLCANLGQAYFSKGDRHQAAVYWHEARNYSDSVSARVFEARAYQIQENIKKAKAIIDKAVQDDANNATARAVWLNISNCSLAEAMAAVPPDLLNDAEVAIALCHKALAEDNRPAAIHHLGVARTAAPDWDLPALNLAGLLLVEAKQSAVVSPETRLVGANKDLAQQALEILNHILDGGRLAIAQARATAYYNRSTAYRLLGDEDKADRDLEASLATDPADPIVITARGICLLERDNVDEAIRLFRRAVQCEHSTLATQLVLASALWETGTDPNRREALSILESARAAVDRAPSDDKFQLARLLSEYRRDSSPKTYSATALPCADIEVLVAPELVPIIQAACLFAMGEEALASARIQSVPTTVARSLGAAASREFLRLCSVTKNGVQVVAALKGRVEDKPVSVETFRLADALFSTGAHSELLELCKGIRLAGDVHRPLIEREAAICNHYENYERAVETVRTWIARNPSDIAAWLWLGNIAIDSGDRSTAQEAVARLPDPAKVAGDQIENAARLVLRCDSMAALEKQRFVYQMWRQYSTTPAAWRALIQCVIVEPPDGHEAIQPPTTCAEYTAVAYHEEGKQAHRVVILCGNENADSARGEISIRNGIGAQLLGKQVDDEIEITSGIGTKKLKVVAIARAEQHAAAECFAEFEDRFPSEAVVRRFELPTLPENATHEQRVAAFKPIVDQLAARQASVSEAIAFFKHNPCTTWVLSQRLDVRHCELLAGILEAPEMELLSVHDQSREAVIRTRVSKETSVNVALTSTSAIVLEKLGLFEKVAQNTKIVVPRRFAQELALLQYEASDSRKGGTIFASKDLPAIVEQDPTKAKRQLEFWQSIRKTLETSCDLTSGMALSTCAPTIREETIELLGPSDARSLAIAQAEHLIALTDEWTVQLIAKDSFGIETLSTGSLIVLLAVRGILSSSERDDSLARLAAMGVAGIQMSPDVFEAGLRLSGWNIDKSPGFECVRALGTLQMADRELAVFTLKCLTQCWRKIILPSTRMTLVSRIMERFEQRDPTGKLGKLFESFVDAAFGLDVLAADEVRDFVIGWRAARGER